MADERPLAWIINRFGQFSNQNHLKSKPRHLPDSETAVQNADVGVYAHQGNVGDAFLFAEVVDLLTVIADAVKYDDINHGVPACPRVRTYPFLHDRIIAAALTVVDGEGA